MSFARATTIFSLFVGIGLFASLLTTPKIQAADFQVCCACRPTPCAGSISTIHGATEAAARDNCTGWCGTAPGVTSCVQGVTIGACQIEVGVRGGPVVGFTNPICRPGEPCTPQIIVGNIIRATLGIVGSIALLMFIIGGFTWMLAQGNTEKVKKAREIMIWAGLGLLVIFASYIIVNFIIRSFTT